MAEKNNGRVSGVLMHVSSLWGEYSCGSFGKSAYEFMDFLAECGFSCWQTLPFCLPDEHGSPYSSYSAFSVNPAFIDLETLASRGLLNAEELASARQRTPFRCEFDRLSGERMELLSRAAERFKDADCVRNFIALHPHTGSFCRFMALRKANGYLPHRRWTCSVPDSGELRTWEFICYEFFREWAEVRNYAHSKGISIIGDIPVYVSLESSDVWENPKQFLLDENGDPTGVAGVPPDYFCADGQLWGNPLYDWDRMRKDGFAWWRDRIAFMCELFDKVRIDHFRGLESFYSIPFGAPDARNGKWVKGPGMELVKALRSVCGEGRLIAEDLGVIDKKVEKLVRESGFPGMRVMQFGFDGKADNPHLPHNYIKNCVAYTGTHDNNTLLGFMWELDPASRRAVLEYCGYGDENWDTPAAYHAVIRTLISSVADTVIIPLQDLLRFGSDTRMNTPGEAEGNWSWRVLREQLSAADKARLAEYNRIYGRGAPEQKNKEATGASL